MYVNNSRLVTFEDCPRKYFWSYVFRNFGIKGRGLNVNLAFGSLIHYMLAHFYAGESLGDCADLAIREWEEEYKYTDLAFDEKNEWAESFAWAGRILKAYAEWAEENDDFEPIQVETEGCVQIGELCWTCGKEYSLMPPMCDACAFCGAEVHKFVFRADLAVLRRGGVYVTDHKTTKSVSDNYLAQWHYSPQLYGYAYAYGKALGTDVSGTCANIIKKLKSIGLESASLKQCPDCRAGKRKMPSCLTCSGRGKVERASKPSDSAFCREWEGFGPDNAETFVRMRLRTIQDIRTEEERFVEEPDAAFPMRPSHCFRLGRCPFVKLCWETPSGFWHDPPEDMLEPYEEKTEDYVSVRAMTREDMT